MKKAIILIFGLLLIATIILLSGMAKKPDVFPDKKAIKQPENKELYKKIVVCKIKLGDKHGELGWNPTSDLGPAMPQIILADREENIYIINLGYDKIGQYGRIAKFDKDGHFISYFGEEYYKKKQIKKSKGSYWPVHYRKAGIDEENNIYVYCGEYREANILKFNNKGNLLKVIPVTEGTPNKMFISWKGNISLNILHHEPPKFERWEKYNSNGKVIQRVGGPKEDTTTWYTSNIDFYEDRDGNVWNFNTFMTEKNIPHGVFIGFDGQGNIYLERKKEIAKYNSTGEFICSIKLEYINKYFCPPIKFINFNGNIYDLERYPDEKFINVVKYEKQK